MHKLVGILIGASGTAVLGFVVGHLVASPLDVEMYRTIGAVCGAVLGAVLGPNLVKKRDAQD